MHFLVIALLAAAPEPLVEATAVVDGLKVDMKYATADNFLHRELYPKEAKCFLLRSAAEKLKAVQVALAKQGLGLKVYDCYRPLSVQWELWKAFPKPGYVADPRTGSHHNRGAAVDLTMVALKTGEEVEMPTAFDTFSKAAHHSWTKGSAQATKNRLLLKTAMEAASFEKNPMEWWHYQLPGAVKFPVRDDPFVAPKP